MRLASILLAVAILAEPYRRPVQDAITLRLLTRESGRLHLHEMRPGESMDVRIASDNGHHEVVSVFSFIRRDTGALLTEWSEQDNTLSRVTDFDVPERDLIGLDLTLDAARHFLRWSCKGTDTVEITLYRGATLVAKEEFVDRGCSLWWPQKGLLLRARAVPFHAPRF